MDSLKRAWDSARGRPVFWAVIALAVLVVAVIAFRPGGDAEEPATPAAERGQAEDPRPREQRGRPGRGGPPSKPPAGSSDEPSTGRFRATGPELAKLIREELGPKTRKGERRIEGARCGGGSCRVVYFLDQPGIGKALEDQRPIWKELFSDPGLREATLVAKSGPRDAPGAGTEIPPPFTLRCTRRQTRGTNWDEIGPEELRNTCEYRGLVEE